MSDLSLKITINGIDSTAATDILSEIARALTEYKEASMEFSYEKSVQNQLVRESTTFSRYINSPTVKEE